jgi:hypothetical protein
MKKLLIASVAALVLAAPAYAQTKTIPHYRKSHGATLVCQEIWEQTTIPVIKSR